MGLGGVAAMRPLDRAYVFLAVAFYGLSQVLTTQHGGTRDGYAPGMRARRLVPSALVVAVSAACGSSDGGGAAASDPCFGAYTSETTSCSINQNAAVLRFGKLDGAAPALLRAGTFTCSTSANDVMTFYPNVTGEWVSQKCQADWALGLKIAKGESASTLTPAGGMYSAVGGKAGSLILQLTTARDPAVDCGKNGAVFEPSGAGTIQLERVPQSTRATCARLTFTDVEMKASDGATFRFSGSLAVKNLPVASP